MLEASTQPMGWSDSLYGRRGEERTRRQTIIADRLGISKKVGVV